MGWSFTNRFRPHTLEGIWCKTIYSIAALRLKACKDFSVSRVAPALFSRKSVSFLAFSLHRTAEIKAGRWLTWAICEQKESVHPLLLQFEIVITQNNPLYLLRLVLYPSQLRLKTSDCFYWAILLLSCPIVKAEIAWESCNYRREWYGWAKCSVIIVITTLLDLLCTVNPLFVAFRILP